MDEEEERHYLTRIAFMATAKTVVSMNEASQLEENSRTNTINRAIQLYYFLRKLQLVDHKLILIYDPKTRKTKQLNLPD